MFEAIVKEEFKFPVVTACAGMEFVKFEYRAIPENLEDEAKANPYLKVRKIRVVKPKPEPELEPELEPEPISVEEVTVPKED